VPGGDQDPGCLGRFVDGLGAGPPGNPRLPLLPPRPFIISGASLKEDRLGSLDLSAPWSSSRARAMAFAMSSNWRSGRWLGGLRFEMAGDS
jgi:hypothetical protein